jgi:hypothetical protein
MIATLLNNTKQEMNKMVHSQIIKEYSNKIIIPSEQKEGTEGARTYYVNKQPSLRMLKDLIGGEFKVIDFEPDSIGGSQVVVAKNMDSMTDSPNEYASEEVGMKIIGRAVILFDEAILDQEIYDWLFYEGSTTPKV